MGAAQKQDDPLAWSERILGDAVKASMLVMKYPELVKVMEDLPAHEDFNYAKPHNHRAIDFQRHWEHSRARIKTVSMDEISPDMADRSADVESEVISRLQEQEFMASLSDEDKRLIELRRQGLTQRQMADEMGYHTHSAIGKRLAKLKERLTKRK